MPHRRRKRKIVSVNSRRPINIDRVFFGAVAVYICVICYMAMTSVHVAGYEVQAGTLAVNHSYTGIALRQETVYQADTSGYVSFYAGAGDRVSGSSLIYTIDEKGETNELIQANAESVDLTDDDFSQIRGDIRSYTDDYSDLDFQSVYEFQASMESSVMELLNQSMLDSLAEAGEDSMFTRVYSGGTGILEYYTDGYESVTVESLTEEMLDASSYEKTNLKKEIVQAGEDMYKLSTSEKWTLVVPLTESEAAGFQAEETDYMEVRFRRDDTTAWANFSVIYVGGTPCARLDFNNSMVRFADLRYIDVEFLVDDETGLKIPNTAIVEKQFYLIPKAFLVEQEDGRGFLKEVYDENGTATADFVSMTLYYEDDDYYYVDPMESDYTTGETKLPMGTYLVQQDSQERFQVGNTGVLKGVYNINKGYTQFRQINILYENEEYALVEQGTSYGLTVYDHIVLNGEAVDEDQIIY
ncbi:MAG: HlyD family efflux transporter periplasmic adaptor subunit [Eubacteriales bacterium]|nr:HlyD family efflux transporter periplasmic adaptor subunit [Eubacteriales bacterium]